MNSPESIPSRSEHCVMMAEKLYLFQQQGKFTDVTICIDGSEFKAHRHILASTSCYFNAMFSDGLLESSAPLVKISGIDSHGFALLLKYMYTGFLHIHEDNVADIVATAVYLQIQTVINKCVDFLKCIVNMKNCLEIVDIANIYEFDELRRTIYEFVSRNLLNAAGIHLRLNVDMLEYVVSHDVPINGSETDMLKFVLEWLLHGTHESRQKYAERIIRHIRFKEIPRENLDNLLSEIVMKPCQGEELKQILLEKYSECQSREDNIHSSRGLKTAVLRIGGFSRLHPEASHEITYSFIGDTHWMSLTNIPYLAGCNYGTTVANNNLYIVGGCFEQYMEIVQHPNGFRYNPCKNSWDQISPMSMDRCHFTLNTLGNKLYAVAGTTSNNDTTNTAEYYDIKTDKWTYIESLPESRQQHAAVAIQHKGANLLFVSGGMHGHTVLASMFMYNEVTNMWSSCAPLLAPRADHAMFTYNGQIYVFGGWYTSDIRITERTKVATIDAYDIEANTWRHVTTVPNTRYLPSVVLHETKLYIIGGFHRYHDFNKKTVVECYDLATDTWTEKVKNPQNYWEHTSVILDVPKYLNI